MKPRIWSKQAVVMGRPVRYWGWHLKVPLLDGSGRTVTTRYLSWRQALADLEFYYHIKANSDGLLRLVSRHT